MVFNNQAGFILHIKDTENTILNIEDVDGNGYYDVNDFLKMNNKEILDMNNGKKFDIILSNPPYSLKVTGDGLYVKFLNKYVNIADKIVSVNPNPVLVGHSSGSLARSAFKEFRNFMDEHYIEINDISSKEFDAGIKSGISIVYIDNKQEHNIIYTKENNFTKEFDKQIEINGYFDNKYLVNFDKCIRLYLNKSNDCFENHMKLTKSYGDFAKAKLKENNPDTNLLYVYFMKPNSSFNYMGYSTKNKNELYKVKEYNEDDQKISCSYVTFKKNELDKANNCLKYINSDFVRICIIFAGLSNFTSVNRYQVVPWLDFSKSYTDEELFEMIGMKYDKEEINKILNGK